MLSDTDIDDHYNPSLRLLEIEKSEPNWGFRLTRSRWDPYPWVSAVDAGSAAETAGVQTGDCLLEVNGADVVGRRVSEVAEMVRSRSGLVSLLLWNAGVDPQCNHEALCCGPMPKNLQRLSACMSTILAFLECPVCLDTIPPPTYQCDNGHLMCMRCRARSERCPICRLRLSRGSRSLVSDQIYNAFTQAFNLKEEPEQKRTAKLQQIFKLPTKPKNVPDIKITQYTQTNKLLSRILGKSSSDDNLASSSSAKEFPPKQPFLSSELKTKSLSSNEINCTISPVLSRASSTQRLKKKNANLLDVDKSESLHASFESLAAEEDVSYKCPYNAFCSQAICGVDIIEHFKTVHEGPLIQYFKPTFTLTFSHIRTFNENSCCVINYDSNVFFLKISTVWNYQFLLWIWCMGDEKKAAEYECVVSVGSERQDDNFLSVVSSVFSLRSVGWQEIKMRKRGVFLSEHVFKALTNISETEINLSVAITKKD